MKKLLLLSTAAALSISAFAQSGGRSIMLENEAHQYRTPVNTLKPGPLPATVSTRNTSAFSGAKTTSMTRTYDYFEFINQLTGGAFSGSSNLIVLQPMWFDSTVRYLFNTGYGTINWSSAAMNIDPVAGEFNDTDIINAIYTGGVGGSGYMGITDSDSYSVDSVFVTGAYLLEKPTRTTADSLIISVVPTTGYWYVDKTRFPWISNFTTGDTLRGYAPLATDSVNRTAVSDVASYPGMTWTVAMDPTTMGTVPDPSTGNITLTRFAWAPPGGSITIPKTATVTVSVTFKSTDHWTKNVDSLNEFNHFMPIWGFESASGSYMTYWRDQYANDRNGGSLMFADDSTRYDPTIIIQGANAQPQFVFQYPAIAAQITCATCKPIATAVNNVVNTISGVKVYPNPANDQAVISYKLTQASDVTVTLSNILGQVISTQNAGSSMTGNVVLNTSNLTEGVYFYTLTANGERSTGRVVVAH